MFLHESPAIAAGLNHLVATEATFAGADLGRFDWLCRDPDFGGKWAGEFRERVGQMVREGKLPFKMSVTEGIDKGIDGFLGMYEGANFGKAVLRIAADE